MANAGLQALRQVLKTRFPEPVSLAAMTEVLGKIRKAKVPLKNYESLLPKETLISLLESRCPVDQSVLNQSEKYLQATKRVRRFLSLQEPAVCSLCPMKSTCPLHSQAATGPAANFLDLAKVVSGLVRLSETGKAYNEPATLVLAEAFISVLSAAEKTDQSTDRELRDIEVPEVIEAVRSGTPKVRRPHKTKDLLKWKPTEKQLLRRERQWEKNESKSTLGLIMKSIKAAHAATIRDEFDAKRKTQKNKDSPKKKKTGRSIKRPQRRPKI